MTILCDYQIQKLALEDNMISPFSETQKSRGIISYGLSSFGYDARLAGKFKIFHNAHNAIINPKNFDPNCYLEKEVTEEQASLLVPPNSFILGSTVERFIMPRNIVAICLGKSTYARAGLIINVTPLEPGWQGHVTIEISNSTPLPALIFVGEGICQFLFFTGNYPRVCYDDREGKYQNQTDEPMLPFVKL